MDSWDDCEYLRLNYFGFTAVQNTVEKHVLISTRHIQSLIVVLSAYEFLLNGKPNEFSREANLSLEAKWIGTKRDQNT